MSYKSIEGPIITDPSSSIDETIINHNNLFNHEPNQHIDYTNTTEPITTTGTITAPILDLNTIFFGPSTGTRLSLSGVSTGRLDLNLGGNSVFAYSSTDGGTWLFRPANMVFTGGIKVSGVLRYDGATPILNGSLVSTDTAGNLGYSLITATNMGDNGVVAGTYGTASAVPTLIVDAKGLITSISNTPLPPPLGWQNFRHSSGAQVISSTPSKLVIDGAGGSTELAYKTIGFNDFWDTTNNKIIPTNTGDTFNIRIDLEITAETSNPTQIILQLDIGGGATPTIPIVSRFITTGKGLPYTISVAFPIFCLATFNTNGGQIFLNTDTGTVSITGRGIFIDNETNGSLF